MLTICAEDIVFSRASEPSRTLYVHSENYVMPVQENLPVLW